VTLLETLKILLNYYQNKVPRFMYHIQNDHPVAP